MEVNKMKQLTKKALKDAAKTYYSEEETYNELWKAVSTLVNLGLIDESFKTTFVEVDHELFEQE